MKKKTVSGALAMLAAVSLATGTFAASGAEFQSDEMAEIFQEEESADGNEDSVFWEDRDAEVDEATDPAFEEETAESFEVNTEAEEGVIVFESDLSGISEEERADLTKEDFLMMQEQSHFYTPGEAVGFYVYAFEGYECQEVAVKGKEREFSLTLSEDRKYEFFMPEESVTLKAEFTKNTLEEPGNEMLFTDNETAAVKAASRTITVKSVASDYKMNPEYAFTYAFRKGVTKLTSVQGTSADLPGKLDRQFGWSKDSAYGTDYKNTFSACSIQNVSQKGRISAKYTNIGEYQGKIVDLGITVTDWGTVSDQHIGVDNTMITPCVLFYNNRIAFSTISAGSVRFKFEFFDNKTGNRIYPKGHITMMDLDGGQGFRIYDGWGVDGMYIRNGYDHLQTITGTSGSGNQYTEVRAPEGVATDTTDVKGWCHVDFNGSFTVNWLSGAAGLKGTSPYMAFFMSGAQTVGTYEPNSPPEKRVGDTEMDYEKMTRHEEKADTGTESPYIIPENREFDYVISQNILPGNYKRFEVTDELDSCLEYKNAEVVTALGNDVTGQFDISETQNTVKFAARSSFLNTDESCNDVTYYFRIHVKVKSKKAVVSHDHYEHGIYYYIPNQAERRLESVQQTDVKETNVSWVRGSIEADCRVRKTDAQDREKILTGAVFEVYQWDKDRQSYFSTGQELAYIEDTKLYTTTEKLRYDTSNEGKFRLIEAQAPDGYDGGWQKDIDILEENFQDTVLEADNTLIRLPCGEITVTKKIREQDIIREHGNPVFRFEIRGTDQKGMTHIYENYVEFQDQNYEKQGEYAVLSYTFQGIPLGEYTIGEKETLRYQFEGITANTSNVTIAGRKGVAVLDRENRTAAVTFDNMKTRYDGYSHTDVIRNRIPLEETE